MPAKFGLTEYMLQIEDPRIERTRTHELVDILVLSVLAVIAGAEGWEDIEEFGKAKLSWLRKFIKLRNGVPSHDTISRVFRMLKPQAFQQAFLEWIHSLQLGDDNHVAIDGKTLRGSHDQNAFQKALHSVGAWRVGAHVLLGQQAVDEKSNEITAIPKLLQILELKGAIITIDAMGCQKEIAAQIVDGGGDYVLALKDNHPTLSAAVETHFMEMHESGEYSENEIRKLVRHDQGHGRVEIREYFHAPIPESMREMFGQWKGATTLGQVLRISIENGKQTTDIRYYVCSIALGVKKFSEVVRGHWGIENSLHWVLDMTFNEDQCRIRKDHGAENFGLLRRFALGIIKRDNSKGSIRKKRKRAAWDENFFLTLLTAAV